MLIDRFGGEVVDVMIIGAGPAGLSAAVNAKARNLTALVLDTREPVAKVRTYPEVTNYLGFPKVTGEDLADGFARHLAKTGYPFIKGKVLRIMPQDDVFAASTDKGIYQSRAIILGMGVAQTAVLPGEERLLGRGLSYCVTCDGALFRGKDVIVVGYIPEGEDEANALAGLARRVRYVAAYDEVGALAEAVELMRAEPLAVEGNIRVSGLKTDAGDLQADGVFIIREAVPIGVLIEGLGMTENYIDVDRNMATSLQGVYAAGDCTGPPFQIAKSVGEGQVAALSAARFVYGLRNKED
jgi:thioredoxin reductase (NADPH)